MFPLTVEWSNGVTSSGDTLILTITGLPAGVYTATVTDALGAVIMEEAEVLDLQTLQFPYQDHIRNTCAGACTWSYGSLPGCHASGVPPYSFTADPPGPIFNMSGNGCSFDIWSLCPDETYLITMSDANNCSLEWNITVVDHDKPVLLDAEIFASCPDGHTGGFALTYDMDVLLSVHPFQGSFTGAITYGPPGQVTVSGIGPGQYETYAYNQIYTGCHDTLYHTVPMDAAGCGTIIGTLYADLNGDCVLDGGDVPLPYRMVSIQPGTQAALSNPQGEYVRGVDYGTYQVDHASEGFVTLCPVDTPVEVTITQLDPLSTVDFAMDPLLGPDAGVFLWNSKHSPGFLAQYMVHLTNTGPYAQQDLAIDLTYDPELAVFLADPLPVIDQPGLMRWVIPELAPFGSVQCSLYVQVPPDPDLIGTTLEATATLSAPTPDADPGNDVYAIQLVVAGPYDPNDKTQRTTSNLSGSSYFLDQDEHVDYTIRFQNVGNAPAVDVYLLDTVSNAFDLMSFVMLGASHPFTATLLDDRVLRFDFPGIMLPDSLSDPLGSQGFVRFRLMPLAPQLGDTLKNAADIFFDFNPPIRTNTATLLVDQLAHVPDRAHRELNVYPNPVLSILSLSGLRAGVHHLEILALDGRRVRELHISGSEAAVSVEGIAQGSYLIRVKEQGGQLLLARFVKE